MPALKEKKNKTEKTVELRPIEPGQSISLKSHFEQFVGQPVAILCCRYAYRGTVSQAHEDFIVLANASAIENAGPARGEKPQSEDKIGGSITVFYGAIEILFQPSWCFAPMEGTDN